MPLVAAAPVHLGVGAVLLLAAAGAGAGFVNGIAGGGTLVSFPTLLALGYPALTANMTSTVGIWPGYLGGMGGYRAEIGAQSAQVRALAVPALAGGIGGAALLLTTPPHAFERLAPWLVLAAALLFAVQPLLTRRLAHLHEHPARRVLLYGGTFGASVYGGYFGAGMGVVLLAILGLALPDSLARTSGLRTVLSVLVNGIAAAVFVARGTLAWAAVGVLALGSLAGGFLGAAVAVRVPATVLRVVVIAIGLATVGALLASQ